MVRREVREEEGEEEEEGEGGERGEEALGEGKSSSSGAVQIQRPSFLTQLQALLAEFLEVQEWWVNPVDNICTTASIVEGQLMRALGRDPSLLRLRLQLPCLPDGGSTAGGSFDQLMQAFQEGIGVVIAVSVWCIGVCI
jgi:hypothetical protein